MSPDLELAPAAVARVAAFPLDRVARLGDPEISGMAQGTCLEDQASRGRYEAAYAAAIERQRAALWSATAGDPAFRRALALSNPALLRALPAAPGPRNKRQRHLETSLYRYLARAVARAEPNGLWAGVALCRLGDRERALPAAPGYFVAPDLAPLQALVRALAERPEYREGARYKLNPTLQRGLDGWRFWAPRGPGLVARRLKSTPAIDAAVAALEERGRFTPGEAALTIAARARLAAGNGRALVDLLISGGAVVGGLRFPGRFECPWEALHRCAAPLEPAHAAAWARATAELRALAAGLEQGLQDMSAEAVADAQDAARAALAGLCEALEVGEVALPRAPLRCDLRAPWTLEFGPERRAALAAAASALSRFQSSEGMGGALSPALVRRWLPGQVASLAGFTPPRTLEDRAGAPLCWEDIAEALDPGGELSTRVAGWARRLAGDAEISAAGTAEAPGAPLGSLLFTLGGEAVGGALVLRGIVRDATPAFSRCAWLLEPAGARALTTWLQGQFTTLAAEAGVDQAELLVAGDNPNVLARPPLLAAAIDLWGTEPGTLDVRGASVVVDPGSGCPFVYVPGRSRPLAVHSLTAAAVPPGDHAQHLLLLSSLRTPPQIPRGDRLAFRGELAGGQHSPRVRLPCGAVVRTRRTALAGAVVGALTGARGALRFALWQRIAAERGWPALVTVRRGDDPPLLVPRDSPLAVEALFEGAAGCTHLYVEEFIDAAWIPNSAGERHVAELALPFVRRRHAWSRRLDGAVAADQRRAVGA